MFSDKAYSSNSLYASCCLPRNSSRYSAIFSNELVFRIQVLEVVVLINCKALRVFIDVLNSWGQIICCVSTHHVNIIIAANACI